MSKFCAFILLSVFCSSTFAAPVLKVSCVEKKFGEQAIIQASIDNHRWVLTKTRGKEKLFLGIYLESQVTYHFTNQNTFEFKIDQGRSGHASITSSNGQSILDIAIYAETAGNINTNKAVTNYTCFGY